MRSNIRAGFTLIELMVAMALTMFIMVILSQAFVISLETFSALKGIGDMQEKLRSASVIIRDDLTKDHFDGSLRVSQLTPARRPQAGFFAVMHGTAPVAATAAAAGSGYVLEGTEATTGFASFRATNQVLYMTVKRKGNRTQDYYTAAIANNPANPEVAKFFSKQTAYTMNPNVDLPSATQTDPFNAGPTAFYSSQWAEVIYYLEQTGTTEEPNNPTSPFGTPIFSLKRAQFVMVPDSTNVNQVPTIPGANLPTFQTMSCTAPGSALTFYSPSDAATGQRIISALPAFLSTPAVRDRVTLSVAATVVTPNVTSFHIQVMPVGTTTFQDPAGQLYDTTNINAAALRGIQISLRVFEPKTRQTRQMTIVQDL